MVKRYLNDRVGFFALDAHIREHEIAKLLFQGHTIPTPNQAARQPCNQIFAITHKAPMVECGSRWSDGFNPAPYRETRGQGMGTANHAPQARLRR